ncbi:hypothetical protein [Paraburkholderia sp. BCC1876]|uniref:hypothetical protein n=1 Tax=Paraburkholderia sp. BCC1876 TaxID=2676303 RepID=UPI00158FE51E|nr:hypothetical protein [Paraburkholderia sp. BCC1876]
MQSDILTQSDVQRAACILDEWARLVWAMSTTAKFSHDEQASLVKCVVALPNAGKLSVCAETAQVAAIQMMTALSDNVREAWVGERWVPEYQELLNRVRLPMQAAEAMMQGETQQFADASIRTKERQDTIGVSSKKALQTSVNALADLRGDSLAAIARELVSEGFEEFEKRSLCESPRKLLDSYESKLSALEGDETTQWMVRLNRHLSIRMKLTAKEYGKSASQLVAMCMTEALSKHEVAAAQAATAAELALARAAVVKVKGPAVRKLAQDVGIGNQGGLMSGMLAGKIQTPRALLKSLSIKLEVSAAALSQVFADSFQSATIPAYKAEEGKPYVRLVPQTWEDAVKSLGLPDDETTKLLQFKD